MCFCCCGGVGCLCPLRGCFGEKQGLCPIHYSCATKGPRRPRRWELCRGVVFLPLGALCGTSLSIFFHVIEEYIYLSLHFLASACERTKLLLSTPVTCLSCIAGWGPTGSWAIEGEVREPAVWTAACPRFPCPFDFLCRLVRSFCFFAQWYVRRRSFSGHGVPPCKGVCWYSRGRLTSHYEGGRGVSGSAGMVAMEFISPL